MSSDVMSAQTLDVSAVPPSSANAVITVENLSKRYELTRQDGGDGLRHIIESAARRPLTWWRSRRAARTTEEFWALRDVSFTVKQGQAVGIIGRNGAAKS